MICVLGVEWIGVDRNEPLGMGGSWRGGSLVTSGSRHVRMYLGFKGERAYLIRLAGVAENGLAVAGKEPILPR